MGEIWKIFEFLIWSTRSEHCITAPKILKWGFSNIFHGVGNNKTEILSPRSGQKVKMGFLQEHLKSFPDQSAKFTIFKIFSKYITLAYYVQFWWSWNLKWGSWGQEIDWWWSHMSYMCPTGIRHVFLYIKLVKLSPKLDCRPIFNPIIPYKTYNGTTGKVQ